MRKYIKIFAYSITLSLATPVATAQCLEAFPGAVGYGKCTTGGRGGIIYRVNSIAGTNAIGTLRYGMEVLTGDRTIVFDVSGYINVTTPLKIRDNRGNVTIAGQTSPAGITIRGAEINIHEGNVIVRHLKVRPGNDAYNPGGLPPSSPDYEPADAFTVKAFSGQGGITNVCLDHLTLTWGNDSIIDFGGGPNEGGTAETRNITLSNSLIAENVDKNYGTLVNGAYDLTMHQNIFYALADRTPAISSKNAEGVNFINNYSYYTTRAAWYREGNHVDFINNVWETGALTREWQTFRMEAAAFGGNIINSRVYLSGNTDDGVNADTAVNGKAIPYLVGTPSHVNDMPIMATASVKSSLIDNVGATLFYDATDVRIMNHIKNGTGGFVSDEDNVGGYPSIPTTTRNMATADTDNDQMIDAAEIAIWGNITTTNSPWTETNSPNFPQYDPWPDFEKTLAWHAGDEIESATPSCSDGIMNGDETGVDCGGSCPTDCDDAPTPNTSDSKKKGKKSESGTTQISN